MSLNSRGGNAWTSQSSQRERWDASEWHDKSRNDDWHEHWHDRSGEDADWHHKSWKRDENWHDYRYDESGQRDGQSSLRSRWDGWNSWDSWDNADWNDTYWKRDDNRHEYGHDKSRQSDEYWDEGRHWQNHSQKDYSHWDSTKEEGDQDWNVDWSEQAENWQAAGNSERTSKSGSRPNELQPQLLEGPSSQPPEGPGILELTSQDELAARDKLMEVVTSLTRGLQDSFGSFTITDKILTVESSQQGFRAKVLLPPLFRMDDPVHSEWCESIEPAIHDVEASVAEKLQSINAMRDGGGQSSAENTSSSTSSSSKVSLLNFEMVHPQDLGNLQQPWPKKMCVLRIHAHFADGSTDHRFGLLLPVPAADNISFGISLKVEGNCGQLPGRACFLPVEVEWPPSACSSDDNQQPLGDLAALICDFHRVMLQALLLRSAGGAFAEEASAALLVQLMPAQENVASGEFDWEVMERALAASRVSKLYEEDEEEENMEGFLDMCEILPSQLELPTWLGPLVRRWFRIHNLGAVSLRFGLAFPVLDPLAMENFLTEPLATFPILCHIGSNALQIFASIASYSQWQAVNLMVQHALEQCLSATAVQILFEMMIRHGTDQEYIRHMHLPSAKAMAGTAPTEDKEDPGERHEAQLQMLKALFGVYFLYEGGGFYAVWRSLCWFIRMAGQESASWLFKGEGELETALGFHCFGLQSNFQGRTPTFTSIQETCETGTTDKLLEVHYDNDEKGGFTGRVWYRRSQAEEGIQERLPNGEWTDLRYSPTLGTFLSKNVLVQPGGNIPSAPGCSALPNKVANITFGQHWTSQVRYKKKQAKAAFTHRTEMILQEQLDGNLWVKDQDQSWCCTSRGRAGNLGEQCMLSMGEDGLQRTGESKQIFWSEERKLLMSSLFKAPTPLSNLVSEWLCHKGSLAMLVARLEQMESKKDTQGKKDSEGKHETDKSFGNLEDNSVKCLFQGNSFIYTCARVSGGCIFFEAVEGSASKVPLLYLLESKAWLSPSIYLKHESRHDPSAAQLPEKILNWITACCKQVAGTLPVTWSRVSRAPWLQNFDVDNINIVMRASGMQANEAEVALNYSFNNRWLLLEAFTHAGHNSQYVAPNFKLTGLGKLLLELLIAEQLARQVRSQLFTTRQCAGDGDKALENFVVPWTPWEERTPDLLLLSKDLGEEIQPDDAKSSAKHLEELLDACNNNVSYAFACVRLQLHKYVGNISTDLLEAANSFAKFVQCTEGAVALPALMRRDAPRYLGDVLAATAAAVFLDSNWIRFKEVFVPILDQHVFCLISDAIDEKGFCKPWVSPLFAAKRHGYTLTLQKIGPKDVNSEDINNMAIDAEKTHTFRMMSLAPPPPAGSESDSEKQQEKHLESAFMLTDLHVYQAMNGDAKVDRPVMATSPRSARRRCALLALLSLGVVISDLRDTDLEQTEISEDGDDSGQQAASENPRGNEGHAVYCEYCEMWLNGPTQAEDHYIGKKHKKNCKKASAKASGVHAVPKGKKEMPVPEVMSKAPTANQHVNPPLPGSSSDASQQPNEMYPVPWHDNRMHPPPFMPPPPMIHPMSPWPYPHPMPPPPWPYPHHEPMYPYPPG